MKIISLIIVIVGVLQGVFGQTPQVPAKMRFAGLQLSITKGGRHKIQKEVDKLRRNDSYFRRYVKKADLHFPVIEKAFREEGCPDEIKYLIIQESGINSVAVSSSNAVGYWQFKKATGVEQGLKISGGIDERKNIKSSSHAAGRYMVGNNKRINNWIYTVMAYQRGVGGAQQYIKDKYRGAKKMEINSQTYWYVIKFLAHKVAFEQEIGKKAQDQKLLIVVAKSGQTVKHIAKKHHVTIEDAKVYNEWIGVSKRFPNDKKYYVILPIKNDGKKGEIPVVGEVATYKETKENYDNKSDVLKLAIPKMTKLVIINDRPAVIPSNKESVVTLARKGGITQKKFRKYNELKSFSQVIAGMPYFYKGKKSKANVPFHTVQAGESTWSIAQKYGMKEWSLRTKNRMARTEALVLGRVLWLSKTRPNDVAIQVKSVPQVVTQKQIIKQPSKTVVVEKEEVKVDQPKVNKEVVDIASVEDVYIVQKGDTYYGISRKFTLTVEELKEINELSNEELSVGQVLKIVKLEVVIEEEEVVSEGNQFFQYEIQQGDTMYGVSKKFKVSVDDILKWNNKNDNSLSVGEKIKIKK